LSNVVLVVRARRAPIKAIALFLQSILKQIAPQSEVVVLLVGRKVGEGFARIEDEEFTYWRNFKAIHRLRVSFEKWSDV
jgi:1-aminocyclopropane-1-carboxylate deaminase/D-cysteine desulfhydrase-like pyridoxal-dependent ACC family enzyme